MFLRRGSLALALLFALSTMAVAQSRPEFIDAPAYSVLPNPTVMAVGDFNGDGKLDIVEGGQGVSTLFGNGDGTFSPGKNSPMTRNPNSIAVADLNHDGKLDLVMAHFLDYVSIMLGNGDGKLDVATAGGTGYYKGEFVSVFRGNGDGTFQPNVNYEAGFQPFGILAADFNGDGAPYLGATGGWLNVLMNPEGRRSPSSLRTTLRTREIV